MQKDRIPYLDYSRVFVAYLVVFGHLLPIYNHIPRDIIYAFHMPFFFLVSGMLHKLNGTIQWKKYLRTIGIPLLFFNLLFFIIVNPFFFRYVYLNELVHVDTYWEAFLSGFSRLWDFILGTGNLPSGVTWFLVALLWCKLLMDVIYCHKKLGWGVFTVLFFVTIGLHIKFLLIRNGMMAFPFYYVGCRYKVEIEKMINRPYTILYAGLCLIILTGLVFLNGRVSVYSVNFGSNHLPTYMCVPLFYITAMVGSLMMLFISTMFRSRGLVTYTATSLITILGTQAIFCDPYRELCPPDNFLIIIPLSVLILFACVGLHWLIMKYIPFALGKTYKK